MSKLFHIAFFRKFAKKAYYTYVKWEEAYLSMLLSPERKVLAGMFKGLQYPQFESSGSGLFIKFIGSYEDELQPFIQKLSVNNYSEIIDIGCAEGYYAVGLANMFPQAKVYAYDIDKVALNRCRQMATLNKVNSRIELREKCDKIGLQNFPFTGNGLIICDCEGYEDELFDEATAKSLKNCDIIIELHDHLVPDIKFKIESAFKNTHKVEFVISRLKSVKDYPLFARLPLEYRQDKYLFERGTQMEWAVITSY
ncbi:MAG: class I SAM-dependent methyltransferase [Bacteroidota bacterium]